MADFTTLVQEVYTITNRSDLVAETALAVKSATLQLHRSDFFYKDLFETALKFDEVNYLQTIEYRALFPGYRALKYLRKYDPTAVGESAVGDFFTIITPGQVLDSYQTARTNVVYAAGDVIQIRSSETIEYCLIGVYINPVVATPETYNSWISDEAMYAIVFLAAAIVFGSVLNNPQKRTSNEQLAMNEFLQVRNSNITAEGY